MGYLFKNRDRDIIYRRFLIFKFFNYIKNFQGSSTHEIEAVYTSWSHIIERISSIASDCIRQVSTNIHEVIVKYFAHFTMIWYVFSIVVYHGWNIRGVFSAENTICYFPCASRVTLAIFVFISKIDMFGLLQFFLEFLFISFKYVKCNLTIFESFK